MTIYISGRRLERRIRSVPVASLLSRVYSTESIGMENEGRGREFGLISPRGLKKRVMIWRNGVYAVAALRATPKEGVQPSS